MWAFIRPDAVAVLKDRKARKSLARYFDVMEDKKHAKFIIAKHIEADFSEDDPTEELWSLHEKLTEEYYRIESKLDRGEMELQDLGEVTFRLLLLRFHLGPNTGQGAPPEPVKGDLHLLQTEPPGKPDQFVHVRPRVGEGAQYHVSRDPGKTIEVGDPHLSLQNKAAPRRSTSLPGRRARRTEG